MKRFFYGMVAAILAVALLGAARVNVTNPFSSDVDGGGHNIFNVQNFITATGAIMAGDGVLIHSAVFGTSVLNGEIQQPFTQDFAGIVDPNTLTLDNPNVGSLYRRVVDPAHGELWFKFGPLATDWQRIAP